MNLKSLGAFEDEKHLQQYYRVFIVNNSFIYQNYKKANNDEIQMAFVQIQKEIEANAKHEDHLDQTFADVLNIAQELQLLALKLL